MSLLPTRPEMPHDQAVRDAAKFTHVMQIPDKHLAYLRYLNQIDKDNLERWCGNEDVRKGRAK
jgi:hypothetical protein